MGILLMVLATYGIIYYYFKIQTTLFFHLGIFFIILLGAKKFSDGALKEIYENKAQKEMSRWFYLTLIIGHAILFIGYLLPDYLFFHNHSFEGFSVYYFIFVVYYLNAKRLGEDAVNDRLLKKTIR